MTIVKRIQCIFLPASDILTSAQWYMDNLGLELIRPADEDQAQLRVASDQAIFLIRTLESTNLNYIQNEGLEQCVLTLEVNDFQHVYVDMKNRGTNVLEIEDNGGCGLNFFAYDPDGNKIEIWGGWPQHSNSEEG